MKIILIISISSSTKTSFCWLLISPSASVSENFDTTTPMGRAMMYISSVFAQLERETISERIRDNMIELSKTGRWLGGTAPLGYKSFQIHL